MKKILTYILIFVMILGTVPVFAEGENAEASETPAAEQAVPATEKNIESADQNTETTEQNSEAAASEPSSDLNASEQEASEARTSENNAVVDTTDGSTTDTGITTKATTTKTTTKKKTTKKTNTKTTFTTKTTSEAAIEAAEKAQAEEAARIAAEHIPVDIVELEASTALLIDETTGTILYSKNLDARLQPGCTAKMLAAMLVIENLPLDQYIVIDGEDLPEVDPAVAKKNKKKKIVTMDLEADEELYINELLCMMMIGGDDTAAKILAKEVAGSESAFVQLMNDKAAEIGCSSTYYTNYTGAEDSNQYTDIDDLVLITQYCMADENFARIANMSSFSMIESDYNKARSYTSSNLLLYDESEEHMVTIGEKSYTCRYAGVNGVISGYSDYAGGCLITELTKNETSMLCIVMNSSDTGRFADAIQLLDWGFANYRTVKLSSSIFVTDNIPVKGGQADDAPLNVYANEYLTVKSTGDDLYLSSVFYLDDYVQAPCSAGTVVGFVQLYNDADIIAEYDVLLAEDVVQADDFLSRIGLGEIPVAQLIIAAVIIALIVVLIIIIIAAISKKRRIKRKAKAAMNRADSVSWESFYEEQMEDKKRRRKNRLKKQYDSENDEGIDIEEASAKASKRTDNLNSFFDYTE